MRTKRRHIALIAAGLLMLCASSCSVERYLGPDDLLLKKNSYEVVDADEDAQKKIESVLGTVKNYICTVCPRPKRTTS